MQKYPIFDLSEEAYKNLLTVLNEHKEYNCVRFVCGSSCCNKPKLDILLDEIKGDDILYKYKDINFVYAKDLQTKIESITLIYNDSTFMLKFEPIDKTLVRANESCANCTNKNGNCHNCTH